MPDVVFNALMLCVDAAALLAVRRWPHRGGVLLGAALALLACLVLAPATALASGWNPGFATLRFCAWGTFLHGFLLLTGGAFLLRRRPRWTLGLGGAALALAAVAVDAFLVEPTALELTHHRIHTDKLQAPLRIGVLADLQTDALGPYERRAIALLLEQEPDLIVLPGDYAHVLDDEGRRRQWDAIAAAFRDLGLAAPLGVFAVQGDVDAAGWQRAFDGLAVETFDTTRSVRRGPVTVTGLTYGDGNDPGLTVEPVEGFHLVLGHRPDFALGSIAADLLIAGHTHGGQVQLPLLGPPITLSRVPRAWADGLTALPGGRHLVVSRGVGMERGHAPRLRFLCRPEVVIVDVLPAAG